VRAPDGTFTRKIFAPPRESRGTDVTEKSRRFGVQHGERFYYY